MKNSDKYLDLLEGISSVFDSARGRSKVEANEEMLGAYWDIGRRIIEVEQDFAGRAQYGDQVLVRLSDDLNTRFGGGFSRRNLEYMRVFFREYRITQALAQLSWAHYVSLLTVNDRNLRGELERLAIEQKWSTRELQKRTRQCNKAIKNNGLRMLSVPEARLFVYAVIRPIKSLDKVVDLGFGIHYRPGPGAGFELRTGTFVESEKLKTKYKIKITQEIKARKERFAYVGYLRKIVDSDTIDVNVDLGFNMFVDQRIRLRAREKTTSNFMRQT